MIVHPARFAVVPQFLPADATGHPSSLRPLAFPAELVWDPTLPDEVRLRLGDPDDSIVWVFAFILLVDGLHVPCGVGNVLIAPAGDRVEIVLRNRIGAATLHFDTTTVRGFVEAVQAVWRPVDIDDAALAAWLAEATP